MVMPRGTSPYEYLLVTVDSITSGLATCSTAGGSEHAIPLNRRVGKGGWAQVGDTWVLSKINGAWVFHAIIGTTLTGPIEIMAPRDSMDAGTEEIFDALIALGFVTEHGGGYQR